MNPNLLLRHFESAANAPDTIPALRRFILDMAVRGKLVSQNAADEPAAKLLKRIASEKKKLEKTGEIKKSNPLPPIVNEEKPFKLPKGWIWCRLEEIGYTQTGTTPPTQDKNNYGNHIPFVQPADIKKTGIIDYDVRKLSKAGIKKGRLIKKDSILMVCIGGSIGKSSINCIDVSCNQQINTVTPLDNSQSYFIQIAFQSPYFQSSVWKRASVGTTPIVNKTKWEIIPIPFPPLAEQKRIVAKVNQLMTLCDKLEAVQKDNEGKRQRLVAATLYELKSPPQSFIKSVRFALSQFADITARPDSIKALRKTILDMAVRGKLVSQNAADEPAAKLLKRIAAEKKRLEKTGGIKKSNPLPPIAKDDIPYAVPDSWEWVRLGDIGEWGSGSTPPRGSFEYYNGDITWFKSGELNDIINLRESNEKITLAALNKFSFRKNLKGDVLFAMYGATIGKVAILGSSAVTNQAVCGCTPYSGIFNRYLFLFLLAKRDFFHNQSEGGAQPNISRNKIIKSLFPLPPLAEQKRIVAKMNQLMTLCDKLEAALITTQKNRRRLLDALLHPAAKEF